MPFSFKNHVLTIIRSEVTIHKSAPKVQIYAIDQVVLRSKLRKLYILMWMQSQLWQLTVYIHHLSSVITFKKLRAGFTGLICVRQMMVFLKYESK